LLPSAKPYTRAFRCPADRHDKAPDHEGQGWQRLFRLHCKTGGVKVTQRWSRCPDMNQSQADVAGNDVPASLAEFNGVLRNRSYVQNPGTLLHSTAKSFSNHTLNNRARTSFDYGNKIPLNYGRIAISMRASRMPIWAHARVKSGRSAGSVDGCRLLCAGKIERARCAPPLRRRSTRLFAAFGGVNPQQDHGWSQVDKGLEGLRVSQRCPEFRTDRYPHPAPTPTLCLTATVVPPHCSEELRGVPRSNEVVPSQLQGSSETRPWEENHAAGG